MAYLFAPSLLSADMMRLGEEVEEVISAGADMIHLDVMDNHYVPNLTFGPLVCNSIRKRFPKLIIDVHLMTTPVDALITTFAEAGATRISIHAESTLHLDRSLQLIRDYGCKAGLAISPAASITCLQWCIYKLDFALIMTVNPGFGGQKLIPEVIPKIALIKKEYPQLPLCVDGGVNSTSIEALAQAGITQFVVGSAIFDNKNYRTAMEAMRVKLQDPIL